MTARRPRWRYLAQPWKYDFEYSRAWWELGFPVYAPIVDEPHTVRMGGKARGMVMRSPRWSGLKMLVGSRLTGLGFVAEGDGWHVEVNSAAGAANVAPTAQLYERSLGPHGSPVPHQLDLPVDDVSTRFRGGRSSSFWAVAAEVGDVTVSVRASGLPDAASVGVERVDDPAPYLRGQRQFMRN